jgi:hypothetical protein
MTLVSEKNFESFESAAYHLSDLGQAIGTPYIPGGKTVEEFVSDFSRIMLGRRFTSAGMGQAALSLWFDEDEMRFTYSSTSGTSIDLLCKFNSEMEVASVFIQVGIPEDRCFPGRCHYEAITSGVRDTWYRDIGKSSRAVKRGCDRPVKYLPTPQWVLDYISDCAAQDVKRVNHVFSRYGFHPVHITGFKFAWKNDCGWVILRKAASFMSHTFYLTQEESTRLPEYWQSFRGVCKELRSSERGKSRKDIHKPLSETVEEEEDYEDYDACLEEDFDEDEEIIE